MDIVNLHRRAVQSTDDVVAEIKSDQLSLPTPCADWTLHGLLRHMVSENLGFAHSTKADPEVSDVDWNAGWLRAEPAEDYRRSAAELSAAFAAEGVLEKQVRIREFGVFPGEVALMFHFVDVVVHSWDVAKTIGAHYEPDEDLPATALELVRANPPARDGGAFAPAVAVPKKASPLEELIAYLGRNPTWPAA
ncbi:TIGR03086 family metal-binding protein [Saccharopolyspora sp. K220]|uniref:TIGR03086 family metal-binding protein n=1 Tax=Saccharopolyspora soli TaxID=2926618 RepID=UPI001F58449F|nr:TIGR03086 family metal-binding protein [Saccharopolyspora soli]MCI2420549.1 TIGR03086 family metal-binding protein [Saccharopolyspora soli]